MRPARAAENDAPPIDPRLSQRSRRSHRSSRSSRSKRSVSKKRKHDAQCEKSQQMRKEQPRVGTWNAGLPKAVHSRPTVKPKFRLPVNMVVLVRPGESLRNVDVHWVQKCFVRQTDGTYRYVNQDMNQPLTLPKRPNMHVAYAFDPPLSEFGHFTSEAIADFTTKTGIHVDRLYAAPFVRCIETADDFVTAMREHRYQREVNVEPGLYEYDTPPSIPDFLSMKSMREAKLQVNEKYTPIVQFAELKRKTEGESMGDTYTRISAFLTKMHSVDPIQHVVVFVAPPVILHHIACILSGLKKQDACSANRADIRSAWPVGGVKVMAFEKDKWHLRSGLCPPLNWSSGNNACLSVNPEKT